MLYSNNPNMHSQMPNSYGNCRSERTCGSPYEMNQTSNCNRPSDNDCDKRDYDVDKMNFPVGMAYVPWQNFQEVYPLEHAFHEGTLFPCLNLEFLCGNPACNHMHGRTNSMSYSATCKKGGRV